MNAVPVAAHLSVVDNKQRGTAIRQRRLRLGIDSVREFADAVGKDRGAVTRAEKGDPRTTENTFALLEAWLDQREEEFKSEREPAQDERPGPAPEGVVTIAMEGVFGIESVTFSGPPEQADEVRRLAIEFMRDVRDKADDAG
jgi:transcriptional regulator with XRE-family HTH domain